MSDLPPITIVMTTWAPPEKLGLQRMLAAWRALMSWQVLLEYPDDNLRLHVADDGSDPAHQYGLGMDTNPCRWWTRSEGVTFSRQERQGVGASLNAGFKTAFQAGPLAAYFVDDWVLKQVMDLRPWARLLMEDESVGMVRLGPPHPNISGTVKHYPGIGWGLLLDRHHYAFGTRPFLMHRRFYEQYGPFTENVSALECERLYNYWFCSHRGPGIVHALEYPWEPIEETHLSEVKP